MFQDGDFVQVQIHSDDENPRRLSYHRTEHALNEVSSSGSEDNLWREQPERFLHSTISRPRNRMRPRPANHDFVQLSDDTDKTIFQITYNVWPDARALATHLVRAETARGLNLLRRFDVVIYLLSVPNDGAVVMSAPPMDYIPSQHQCTS